MSVNQVAVTGNLTREPELRATQGGTAVLSFGIAVYNGPRLWQDGQTPTEWLLQNFDASYKVILVGDAAMNPYELREKQYDWQNQRYGPSGLKWLELFKKHFPYLIWLNPEPLPAFQDFWTLTHLQLAKMFPMFDLSAEGLEQGMKRLMVRR